MIKNTNVEILAAKIEKLGYEVGCIDNTVNALTQKALKAILENIDEEYTDVFVEVRKKLYVVEISTMDMKEKDVSVYEGYRYFSKYGNLEDAYENEDITESQYNKLKAMGV